MNHSYQQSNDLALVMAKQRLLSTIQSNGSNYLPQLNMFTFAPQVVANQIPGTQNSLPVDATQSKSQFLFNHQRQMHESGKSEQLELLSVIKNSVAKNGVSAVQLESLGSLMSKRLGEIESLPSSKVGSSQSLSKFGQMSDAFLHDVSTCGGSKSNDLSFDSQQAHSPSPQSR